MGYLWLKAFHIIAVMTWIGGLLVAAMSVAAGAHARARTESASWLVFLERTRRWDRQVTTPAMLLVWALGLILALTGEWFPETWLQTKFIFVFLLSALHGMLAGNLRRLCQTGEIKTAPGLRHAPVAIVLGVFAIVTLAVIKPFGHP
ncbi:MAG: CopD family protein [Magnetospirillum sp.]|nr:CopD family protein [Magnetospirillum sp.]